MAARSIGSGTISFGLVTIPVKLYTATSPKAVSFATLHSCGARVKQQLVCPAEENRVIEHKDTVRGFEHRPGEYVRFTEEDLKALEAARPSVLELVQFVPAESVDLLYVERSTYLGPDKGGALSYRLLSRALEQSGRIGVGRYAKRGKDTLVLVRPYHGGLLLHEAYYANEVLPFDAIDLGDGAAPTREQVQLATTIIRQLDAPAFDPKQFRDEWADRVNEAVQQKVAGAELSVAPAPPVSGTFDLLEALQRSVAELGGGRPANEAGPKKAAKRKAPAGGGERRRRAS